MSLIKLREETLKKTYLVSMTIIAGFAFFIILYVPFWYDQMNYKDFKIAEEKGNLIIREYGSLIVQAQLLQAIGNQTSADLLKDKKLISLDYINQMHQAGQLEFHNFTLYACVVILFLMLVVFLILKFSKRYLYRISILTISLSMALVAMQFFGLPHTNKKFHMIIGIIYITLFVISDFLHTLDIGIGDLKSNGGALSALQYKHRFWTVIFNLSSLSILTLLATVSFKLIDLLTIFFGENFVTRPLLGLLFTLGIGGIGILFGIFRPIRRHLVSIEEAMANQ